MENAKNEKHLENESLFVDVHKKPKSVDTLHEPPAKNNKNVCDDSDYLESTLGKNCDSCGEERPLIDGKKPKQTRDDCKQCISFSSDTKTTKQDDSLKWKPSHLVKSVFQDSLRNLLDSVGNDTSTSSKPSSKKLCVSLTNLTDSRGLESTSL